MTCYFHIFISTFTGVVIIDDQPEVSIDDPAFLFEKDEGFQEVMSRKSLKNKQRLESLVQVKETPVKSPLSKLGKGKDKALKVKV